MSLAQQSIAYFDVRIHISHMSLSASCAAGTAVMCREVAPYLVIWSPSVPFLFASLVVSGSTGTTILCAFSSNLSLNLTEAKVAFRAIIFAQVHILFIVAGEPQDTAQIRFLLTLLFLGLFFCIWPCYSPFYVFLLLALALVLLLTAFVVRGSVFVVMALAS